MSIMKAVWVRQDAFEIWAILYYSYIQLSNNLHFPTLNIDLSKLSLKHQMSASHTICTAVFV